MKKILVIATIGATTAFLQVQAQEAPSSERDQSSTTQTEQSNSTENNKVKIDQSKLPQVVLDSFEKSEYSDMEIVSVYEVQSTSESSSTSYELTTSDGNKTSISAPSEENEKASAELEQAANQTEQSTEQGASELKQDAEVVVEEEPTERMITETETTEETEETGQIISAEAPEVSDTTDQPTAATNSENMGRELYENNQYDNYTEANSDAYEKIAEEEADVATTKSKQYELEIKSEQEAVTLTYDEKGELMKTRRESM